MQSPSRLTAAYKANALTTRHKWRCCQVRGPGPRRPWPKGTRPPPFPRGPSTGSGPHPLWFCPAAAGPLLPGGFSRRPFAHSACCRAASLRSPAPARRARSARVLRSAPRAPARPRARFRAPSGLAAAVCLRARPRAAAGFLSGALALSRAWPLCSASACGGPAWPLRASPALRSAPAPLAGLRPPFPPSGGRGLGLLRARPAALASPFRRASGVGWGSPLRPPAPPPPLGAPGGPVPVPGCRKSHTSAGGPVGPGADRWGRFGPVDSPEIVNQGLHEMCGRGVCRSLGLDFPRYPWYADVPVPVRATSVAARWGVRAMGKSRLVLSTRRLFYVLCYLGIPLQRARRLFATCY